jgi:voltage-gated potassium channel
VVTAPETAPENTPSLRSRLRELYFGTTPRALTFQGWLLAFDVLLIGFFVASQFLRENAWFYIIDYLAAALIALDMGCKLYALGSIKRWLRYPTTWIDGVVLLTLLFPALLHNWGFLRILRLWTLVHRERFWNVLGGGKFDDTRAEDLTKAIVNMVVFILLTAGLAQVLFLGSHPKLNNFLDAIYFVVTALTTTGFGDITIDTATGRIFSIVLMITGITLFFGIAQKVFAPQDLMEKCSGCGLDRHAQDAKYCKRCGTPLTGTPLRRAHRHKTD